MIWVIMCAIEPLKLTLLNRFHLQAALMSIFVTLKMLLGPTLQSSFMTEDGNGTLLSTRDERRLDATITMIFHRT